MGGRTTRLSTRHASGLGATVLALSVSGALVAPATSATPAEARAGAQPRQVSPTGLRPGWVDPFVGTGGSPPWFSGNTTPAAARPFGMVQLGPDTTADAEHGTPSRAASGYSSTEGLVRGFSATHLSGAGCPAFGDVPLLPLTGGLPADPATATVPLVRDTERAGPGWYRTSLGDGTTVSLAAAERAGLAAFSFPADERGLVLVKAGGSLAGVERARVAFTSRREVVVTATSGHFCGSPGTYRVHVVVRFDRAAKRRGTWGGTSPEALSATGPRTGAWLDFGRGAGTVKAQVAVSFVDVAGARGNLADARLGWSLARLRASAREAWRRELGRVAVAGGTEQERRTFGTALYHVLLHPTLLSDADGRYPGFDGQVHRAARGHRQYTALSGWDAYRTHLPLLAWLRPDVASDVARSLLRAGREGGAVPRWPLVAAYTGIMNGDSGGPMVAAVHAFGGRDFSLPAAVSALGEQAERTDAPRAQGWFEARPGLADYLRLGFVPHDRPWPGPSSPYGASTTLEYAVDDFAVSRLAAAAGREALATRLRSRSAAWTHLLDPERRVLAPRDSSGAFPGPEWEPERDGEGFQEGNAVQYTWAVPHDLAGLLGRLGTHAEVLARLDEFHRRLNAGAGEPHAWMGNQVTLATPWAALWLGAPTHTQDVVRRVREELWTTGPDGLPGNDDLGGLSAWYVWATLGLYPLIPGTPVVGVSTPAFDQVVVRPAGGRATRILRSGSGLHVTDVLVDGASRSRTWLRLGPGSRPARVEVVTTDDPAPAWGTGPADAPPSYPPGG